MRKTSHMICGIHPAHTKQGHQTHFFYRFFPGVMGHAMRIPEICIFTNARSWLESLIRIGAALSNHVLPRHSGLSQGGRHPPSGPRGHLTDATDSEAAGLDQLKKAWGRSVWVSRCGSCGKQKPLCRSLVPIPNLRGGNKVSICYIAGIMKFKRNDKHNYYIFRGSQLT